MVRGVHCFAADEILSIDDRLRHYRSVDGMREGELADAGRFLVSIHPSFSLRTSPSGLILDEEERQNGQEIHDTLMAASDEDVARLSEELLTRLRPFLSTVELNRLHSRRGLRDTAGI